MTASTQNVIQSPPQTTAQALTPAPTAPQATSSDSSSPPPSYLASQLAKPWAKSLRQEVAHLRETVSERSAPLAIDALEPVTSLVTAPAFPPEVQAHEETPPSDLWDEAPPLEPELNPKEPIVSTEESLASESPIHHNASTPSLEQDVSSSLTVPTSTVAVINPSGFQRWRVTSGGEIPLEQTNWSEVHDWLKKFLHARRLDTPAILEEETNASIEEDALETIPLTEDA